MFLIEIKTRGCTPAELKKQFGPVLKECWTRLGEQWHATLRERHFTHAGATEYHYDKRTIKYNRDKYRKFGHTLPLVWSGASRTLSGIRNVKATKMGVRVVMNTPTLNFRKGKLALGKTMREEMTTVTDAEAAMLTDGFVKSFERATSKITAETFLRM